MRRFQVSTCVIVVAAILLALAPSGRASAQDGPEVVFDPEQSTKAIGINNLTIDGTIYNVTFTIVQRAAETYGAFPGVYEFTTEESAAVAVDAVAAVLTEAEVHVVGADEGEDFPSFRIGFKGFEDALGIALVRIWEAGINFKGAWNRFAHDDTLIYHDDFRTWATFTVVGGDPPPGPGDCVDDLNGGVVCLRDGRFEITAEWTDFSNPPVTQPLIWTPVKDINASGGFQNNPDGVQIVMRIADGCSHNGHWWIWLGGFTDAGWDITVRDTVTDIEQTHIQTPDSGVYPTTDSDRTTFSCN